jgi:hypothetical protein
MVASFINGSRRQASVFLKDLPASAELSPHRAQWPVMGVPCCDGRHLSSTVSRDTVTSWGEAHSLETAVKDRSLRHAQGAIGPKPGKGFFLKTENAQRQSLDKSRMLETNATEDTHARRAEEERMREKKSRQNGRSSVVGKS